MNWTWLIVRSVIALSILVLLFLSQRFWYRAIWRMTSNWGSQALRVVTRLIYVTLLLLSIAVMADGFRMGHGHAIPRASMITVFSGLWFFSALFGYVAVKLVSGIDKIWSWLRAAYQLKTNTKPSRVAAAPAAATPYSSAPAAVELIADPSRRYFSRRPLPLPVLRRFLPRSMASQPNGWTIKYARSKSHCRICRPRLRA